MKYIRTNIVDAEPMAFGKFKEKFPKSGVANVERDPADKGYVITYRKDEPNEYVSWCPKAEFDAVSRPVDGMTFGMAIEKMRHGFKVARKGWNGKDVWLWLDSYDIVKIEQCENPYIAEIAKANGGMVELLGRICMKTADNMVLTGWFASQADMLSDDWVIVD